MTPILTTSWWRALHAQPRCACGCLSVHPSLSVCMPLPCAGGRNAELGGALRAAQDPNAAEVFYRIITGKGTPVNALLEDLNKVGAAAVTMAVLCLQERCSAGVERFC